jgi:DNA-binding beta-propeller fold protein YncE
MTSLRSRSAALLAAAAAAGLLLACSDVHDKTETRTQPLKLSSPVRLAPLDGSTLVVSDHGGRSVCLVDRTSLAPTSCFSVNGRPLGVAGTRDTVYVGNDTAHAVERYDRSGNALGALPGTFTVPASLAVDEQNGLLFVLDTAAKTISVLTPSGNPVRTITGDASGSGQLVNPVAMTVDPARQALGPHLFL